MRSMLMFSGLGGQDAPPIERLRALYSRASNARFFTTVFGAVRDSLTHVGHDTYRGYLPDGLPLQDWLLQGRVRGPHSLVEGICTHIYHLCLMSPGGPRWSGVGGDGTGPGQVVATVGHSLGLQSAVIAALGVGDTREYLAFCRQSMMMVALGMLRTHQVSAPRTVEPDHAARYVEAGGPPGVGPMACVMGIPAEALSDLIDRQGVRADGGGQRVELGLVNATRFCVLTGGAAALMGFWLEHRSHLTRPGVRWFYLRATAPFHSRALEPAVHLFDQDRDVVDYAATGPGLAVPVYTTMDPGNLQRSQDLYLDSARQIMSRPQDWPAVVGRAVSEMEPEVVIDFGPGSAAQIFTRSSLRAAGYELKYATISCPA